MLYLNHNQTGGIFMKVKIMDYETAKAKVLAREHREPYVAELANDNFVWGVRKSWAGWG